MKAIYRAPTLETAEEELESFRARWDGRFSQISRICKAHWANLAAFFD